MKILFVLEHFYPYIGGAEKLFFELTKRLVKEGVVVTVITTKYDNKLPAKEVHEGVQIIRVNCQNRFLFTVFSLPKIIRLARNYDLIHTTTYTAALPAFIGGLLSRKPVFITFHEVWGDLWSRLPFLTIFKRTSFYCFEKVLLALPFDKFIAVSEFTKTKLIQYGIPKSKIERIYNGIEYEDFESYKHNPPEVFTFTYFGRLGVSKGLDLLIPATAEFRKSHPDFKLKLIIPKYPKAFYRKIMQLIQDHDLENNIEFRHDLPRRELYNELIHSSCVVIPSYSEGFCFAAAETIALGVPLISSQQGALKEVVSGRFIEMEEMTSAALTVALKAAYLQKWSEIQIKKYDLHKSIAGYLEIYKTL